MVSPVAGPNLDSRPYLGNRTVDAFVSSRVEPAKGNSSLWSSPRPISTGQLHVLPRFHFLPINPVV